MSPRKPRVAYFSPLNPDPSGISDYSEELLPHLAELWRVDLFVDGYEPSREISQQHRVIDCTKVDPVPLLADYDAVLYQFGNSESHAYIHQTIMRWPGLVVLHEFSIQHLVAKLTMGSGRPDLYLAAMRANHGDYGAERARRSLFGDEPPPWESDPLEFPMNNQLLGQATGVLAHSRFVAERVEQLYPGLLVSHVDHHASPVPSEILLEPAEKRAQDEGLRIVTAGNLTPNKGIHTALFALARIRQRVPFRYELVGRCALNGDLETLVTELGLEDRVDILGRVSKTDLLRRLRAADICICLRDPTLGETSGIAMRALACGRPVVVSDEGWFSELPDEVAIKLPRSGRPELALAELLEELAGQPERLEGMRVAAASYASERSPEKSALGYDAFVREAGLFPVRWLGRAFHRQVERCHELDVEYPACAARRSLAGADELMAWRQPAQKRPIPSQRQRLLELQKQRTRGRETKRTD